jgi:hypothetical protein
MWNPTTNGIHETRDIIWLRRMYYEKTKPTFEVIAPVEINPNDDVEQEETFEVGEGENQDEDKDDVTGTELADTEEEEEEVLEEIQGGEDTTTRSGRVTSKPTRLIEEMDACSYEIGLSAAEEEYYNTMWKMSEMALVGA